MNTLATSPPSSAAVASREGSNASARTRVLSKKICTVGGTSKLGEGRATAAVGEGGRGVGPRVSDVEARLNRRGVKPGTVGAGDAKRRFENLRRRDGNRCGGRSGGGG